MIRCAFFSAIMLAVLLTGCSGEGDEMLQETTPQQEAQEEKEDLSTNDNIPLDVRSISLTDQQTIALEHINDFAFNYFRNVITTESLQGNTFVVSPQSLLYVLGMLNAGAIGQTSLEITQMLGYSENDKDSINELCRVLIENSPFLDNQASLKIANLVATNQPVTLMDDYSKTVSTYYDAESVALQFHTPEAVNFVNQWCDNHTDGKIPTIVEQLDGDLVLINAISFKAPWSGKFVKQETREESFTQEDGTQLKVSMMHRDDLCYYYQNDTFSSVGLPYGNGTNWSMYVLMPNQDKTLDDVIALLNADYWKSCVTHLARGGMMVDVKLPRFKALCDVVLCNTLKQMGAGSMFKPRKELSMMTNTDLYVSLIKQKTTVEVTEDGSEAASVSFAHVHTSAGSDMKEHKVLFHATHPFVFLIQENTTGAIFFIGTFQG